MHEMSLVRDVVDVVAHVAEEHGIRHVGVVNMTIGYGRDIVPALFDDLFRHLSRGTAAEGAELVVTNTPYMVRCRQCGCVYHINTLDERTWDCPACGQRSYDVVSGLEFRIDSITEARDANQVA